MQIIDIRKFKPAARRDHGRHVLRLTPVETVNAGEHRQTKPSTLTVECPRCLKNFLEGAVVSSDVMWGEICGQHYVVRRVYCDHCNHLVVWEQACNARGDQLGLVLDHSIVRNIPTIERFLKANPQAAGVAQV